MEGQVRALVAGTAAAQEGRRWNLAAGMSAAAAAAARAAASKAAGAIGSVKTKLQEAAAASAAVAAADSWQGGALAPFGDEGDSDDEEAEY